MTAVADAEFGSTSWSVVLQARSDDTRRHKALEKLCASYWLPIYSYLRRRGHSPHDTEDLTQSFFSYVLESDFLDRPDPAKGRFRGYLVGALRHFLGSHYERANAQKRGGGSQFVNWGEIEAEQGFLAFDREQLDPSEAYETSWAFTLLAQALKRLEEEQIASGKVRAFQVLKPFLSANPSSGDYDQAAKDLDTTRTNVAVWVHRLNHRYAELVKLEVAATVSDPTEVKQEMRHLLAALRR